MSRERRIPAAPDLLLGAWAAGLAAVAATLIAGATAPPPARPLPASVSEARPTGLALFAAARYTRHPAQADRFAAFQSHPGALDHFPAGSVLPPAGRGGRP